MYRVGILAALRSLKTQSVIGLMITASHNKVSDNGVKIADPNGGMLSQQWEPFADSLANASDPLQLVQVSLFFYFLKTSSILVFHSFHFEGYDLEYSIQEKGNLNMFLMHI